MSREIEKNYLKQNGIVLPSVLFLMTIITLLLSDVIAIFPLQHRSILESHIKAQEFQSAQTALQYGEKEVQLKSFFQQIIPLQDHFLDSFKKDDILINLQVRKFPENFCVLPYKRIGHYYQLEACASSCNRKASDKKRTCLESTFLVVDTQDLCSPKLMKRREGRSAWCQLS